MDAIFKTTKSFYAYYYFNSKVYGRPVALKELNFSNRRNNDGYIYNTYKGTSGIRRDSIREIADNRNYRDLTDLTCSTPGTYTKVFVSKACSIPRDVVRMNYTIVKNKEKADIVIIPQDNNMIGGIYYDCIVARMANGDNCKVSLHQYYNSPYGDESKLVDLIPVIQKQLENYLNTTCEEIEMWKYSGLFRVRRCDEYQDLVDDDGNYTLDDYKHKALYIKEYSLPLAKVPNPLSGEGLAMMLRQTDNKILEKLVTGSDWSEYPFTMFKFLDINLNQKLRNGFSRSTLSVMDTLKQRFKSHGGQHYIEPKDYNMYQDFCLAVMGIQGEKGLGSIDKYGSFGRLFSEMPAKVAMVKMEANAPIDIEKL